MAATVSSDFAFEPKVWSDHVSAYFDRKLVYGAFALRDNTLQTEPGLTQNFPYFEAIGAAEEPAETDSLTVDNLEDDSFSATIKEVGKAVGVKKKAFKKSAAKTERIIAEIQAQIGRVMAEKVDGDLLTEIKADANSTEGYLAAAAANKMSPTVLMTGKVKAFGDKHKEAVVCFMHSLQYLDLTTDSTVGMLKADANDPAYLVEGFEGRLLGMAVVTVDTVPLHGSPTQIDSKDAYRALIMKKNSYGILLKQDNEMESDYDILARQWVFTGNQWYGVKSFHAKISASDKKAARVTTTIS
jgi:hypothetical protein